MVLCFCCKELFLNLPEITPKMPGSPEGRGVIFPINLKGLIDVSRYLSVTKSIRVPIVDGGAIESKIVIARSLNVEGISLNDCKMAIPSTIQAAVGGTSSAGST